MSYFTRIEPGVYRPSPHTEGAWSKEDYHFAALAGLVTHVTEQHQADQQLQLSRISFDILGRLPLVDAHLNVHVTRPGRTIELVETTCTLAGRSAIIARAWYLQPGDTAAAAGTNLETLPAPEACPPRDLAQLWPGGFIAQLEARTVRAYQPGRAAVWLRSPHHIVEGEEPIPVAEYVSRIDVANGIAVRKDPTEWMFPNVDLTVHFFRQPDPEWVGLDTTVSWGSNGLGLTSSVLHDVAGPLGRAEQSLTIRPL